MRLKGPPGGDDAMTAAVEPAAGTFGFQPVMWPVMDAKRKRAEPLAEPEVTTKSVAEGLATVPVGMPTGTPGMVTACNPAFLTSGAPPTSPR
jgi:hypothetical protein